LAKVDMDGGGEKLPELTGRLLRMVPTTIAVQCSSGNDVDQPQSELARVHQSVSFVDEDAIQRVVDAEAELRISRIEDSAFRCSYHADDCVKQRRASTGFTI